MKRICKYFLVLLILLWANLVYSESIIYCNQPADLFYNSITSKLYLACAGDFSTLDLITIDPITLTEDHKFYIGGLADAIIPVDGGVNLLLLLSNVDGDTSTNDGVLRKVDSATGEIIPGYEVEFNDCPLTMVTDNNQIYLYVSWGISIRKAATINKIRISDFQVMPESVDYAEMPFELALSNDNSKLYVRNEALNVTEPPLPMEYHYNIGVFNTADMTMKCEINLGDFMPYDMEMGYDNRLFLSFPIPEEGVTDNISLIVIDTLTDEVIESISLNEEGIGDISIDPINQKLYGTSCPKDYFDPEYGKYIHRPTEIIVQFDLNDPTYTPFYFTLGNEGLLEIAVASTLGSCRIFAFADDISIPFIYYMDL